MIIVEADGKTYKLYCGERVAIRSEGEVVVKCRKCKRCKSKLSEVDPVAVN